MIVLDTNVISELVDTTPAETVVNWYRSQHPSSLYTTSVTVAEALYGLEAMPRGKRRYLLEEASEHLFRHIFAGRILAFDEAAARHYGPIVALRKRLGRPVLRADAYIAAICLTRSAALATRNVPEFDHFGIEVINPWDA